MSGIDDMERAAAIIRRRRADTRRRAALRYKRARRELEAHRERERVEGYAGGLFGVYWIGEQDYPPGRGVRVRARERDLFIAKQQYLEAEVEAARAAVEAFDG